MSYWNEIFCKRPKRGKKVVIVVGSKKAITIAVKKREPAESLPFLERETKLLKVPAISTYSRRKALPGYVENFAQDQW